MPTDTGFGDFAEKFWKISENHENYKTLENSVWNWNWSNQTTRKVKSGGMPISGSRSGSGLTLRLRIQIRYQKTWEIITLIQILEENWNKMVKKIRTRIWVRISGTGCYRSNWMSHLEAVGATRRASGGDHHQGQGRRKG